MDEQENLKRKLDDASIPEMPDTMWYALLFNDIGKVLRKEKEGIPDTQPTLTEEFKKKISDLGGTDETFLIQKALYHTDLTKNHNRLSMPLRQIKAQDFLQDSEITRLKKGVEVSLLQPCLEVWEEDIFLSRWNMNSSVYVLRGSWFRMAQANDLEDNDIIQVWSFRVEGKLCLAVVKI